MKKYILLLATIISINNISFNLHAQESVLPNDVKQMMMDGDYSTAIESIKNLLHRDSTNFDLLYNLGLSHQRLFQYNKAREVLYKAYEYEKFDIPLLLTMGRNYKYMGASNYAALFFEQAFEIDSTDKNILLELANAYLESFEIKKAQKYFKNLYEADTTNAYLCKQLAYCNFKLGNNSEAINLYIKAQKLNHYDATIAIQLGNLLVRREEYERAYFVVKRGLHENGNNAHLNRLAAEILFKLKRYNSARPQYESIINNGDSTAVHYQRLGFCYFMTATDTTQSNDSTKVERIKKAVDAFTKAVEHDEDDALSCMYLGLSYKELDSLETSNRILKQSIDKMIPDHIAIAYAQLGNNNEVMGNYKNAIKAFRKAGDYSKENVNIIFQLAALYDKYYEDKNVSMIYYKKYLRETEVKDERIVDYINQRIDFLEEYLHFRK